MGDAEHDILASLVALLKSDAAVVALAGANIFATELPQDAGAQMPRAALVVQASGGVSLTDGNELSDTQRVDLFAYGKTPKLANDLMLTATRLLRRTKRRIVAGVLIHWIKSAGGFFTARERDGLWPQSFRSFQIFHSLQET